MAKVLGGSLWKLASFFPSQAQNLWKTGQSRCKLYLNILDSLLFSVTKNVIKVRLVIVLKDREHSKYASARERWHSRAR